MVLGALLGLLLCPLPVRSESDPKPAETGQIAPPVDSTAAPVRGQSTTGSAEHGGQAEAEAPDAGEPVCAAGAGSDFEAYVREVGAAHGVDPALVFALIRVESRGESSAVSPGGAMGLMQLMPHTAARFGVSAALNPCENVLGGVRYLRYLSDRYSNQIRVVLAAYQTGEGRVDRYGGVPPYSVTHRFIDRVLRIRESLLPDPLPGGEEPRPVRQAIPPDGEIPQGAAPQSQ